MGNPKNGGYDALTQGELKKRLNNEVQKNRNHIASTAAGEDEHTYEAMGRVDVADFALNVLDEAKKDYALIDEFRYNKPGKPFMSQEEAREKWFKKWFGDDEP